VDTSEGPRTSKCTRSKGAREEEILLLKGKAKKFCQFTTTIIRNIMTAQSIEDFSK